MIYCYRLATSASVVCVLALSLFLTGCNDNADVNLGNGSATTQAGSNTDNPENGGNDGTGNGGNDTPDTMPPTVPVAETRAGTVYDQQIQVQTNADAVDTVVFTVMEPSKLVEGESYPLVLHGHGYGGSRSTEPDAFQQRLRDAGYYVISIDQRGFGKSSGTVRVMSPDFEGQDPILFV